MKTKILGVLFFIAVFLLVVKTSHAQSPGGSSCTSSSQCQSGMCSSCSFIGGLGEVCNGTGTCSNTGCSPSPLREVTNETPTGTVPPGSYAFNWNTVVGGQPRGSTFYLDDLTNPYGGNIVLGGCGGVSNNPGDVCVGLAGRPDNLGGAGPYNLVAGHSYRWWVRIGDSCGNKGPWTYNTITVSNPTPPPPNCSNLTGPATIVLGQTATFTASFTSPASMGILVRHGRNGSVLGPWPPVYPGGTSATRSFPITPTAVGTYTVFCDVWNDSVAERAGAAGFGIPVAAGPNGSRTLTVVAPTATPIPPWPAPTGLTGSCSSGYNYTLRWNAVVGNPPIYETQQCLYNASGASMGCTTGQQPTTQMSPAGCPGCRINWRVGALGNGRPTTWSPYVNTTCAAAATSTPRPSPTPTLPACPTTSPTNFSPSGTVTPGTRNITWNAVANATGYDWTLSVTGPGGGGNSGSTAGPVAGPFTMSAGQTWSFSVRPKRSTPTNPPNTCYGPNGGTNFTVVAATPTPGCPATQPTNLQPSGTVAPGSRTFTWNAVPNAANYDWTATVTGPGGGNNSGTVTTTQAGPFTMLAGQQWTFRVTPRRGTCLGPLAQTIVSVASSTATPRPSSTPTRVPGTNTPTVRPPTRTPTATRTGTPIPTTCVVGGSVNLSPSSSTVTPGNTRQFEAVISGLNACGNTVEVRFSSNDTSVATVAPAVDTSARYQTVATVPTTATAGEQATIRADVYIGGVLRFSDTSRITVGSQTCDFDLTPSSAAIGAGATQVLQVSNITQSGTIDEVQFSSSDNSIVSVNPLADSSPTYRTTATGNVIGTATVTADMIMGGTVICSDSADIEVSGADPWWQSKESDVITNGDIVSEIPSSCTPAVSCSNSIITYDSGEYPGIAVGNSIDPGTGNVSQSYDWQSTSGYDGPQYSYEYFENKATCGTFSELSNPNIDSLADLTSGTQTADGYYWVRYTGGSDVTISSNLNIGSNRIVLFVENSDLIINGDISLNDGTGFFLAVIGGNIIVDPAIGGPADSTADLEGLYFTSGQFRTGTNGIGADEQLHIRGSVAAFDKILLERSTPNDATAPAELFEYAPETLLRFPTCLGERSVEWRELAP